jgi:Replication-relaxation
MSRVEAAGLVALADAVPERERQIIETTGRLRLVAGKQLERMYFSEIGRAASRARAARRIFAGLTEQGVLFRLERRIGGVRAGSAGHIYGLGPLGKRLLAYWQGEGLTRARTPHEPGPIFVRHTLAVAEQFVTLVEAERAGRFELVAFQNEPDCWRPLAGAYGRADTLKPDAFVRLGLGEFEERSFIEVDCGTEGRGALLTKCRRYTTYFQSGIEQAEHGVFPRVVWITTNQERVGLLVEVCASLAPEHWRLFSVGTASQVVALCSGAVASPLAAQGGRHG